MRLKKEYKEALRKRINLISVNNPGMQTNEIVHHFEKEGYARRTVYNAFDRNSKGQPIFDKKRSGRSSTWTSSMKTSLHRLVNNRKEVSQRKFVRKFGINKSTIGRQIKKIKIDIFSREKTPKYSEKQAKKLRRKLVDQLYGSNLYVIMDDEKYFTFDVDIMPGNDRYYTNDKNTCPDKVRFFEKDKFRIKLLMWIAIFDEAMSELNFRFQNEVAIKSSIYVEECLKKRLLPFIHRHYPDFNYIFGLI